jgi:hypoxanthine phosphoribosyltransferase
MSGPAGPSAAGLRLCWDRTAITARVCALAAELDAALPPGEVVLVGVLPGGLLFLADLARALPRRVLVDLVLPGGPGGPGAVGDAAAGRLGDVEVADRHVLVVDDIVESGRTVAAVLAGIAPLRPATLAVCAFLARTPTPPGLPIAAVGFTVGGQRLAGYGLPLDGRFATRPDLWCVADDRAEHGPGPAVASD